ncbi:MAG: isopentenyl-diphosphate Delta-isomerase [Flavobacteriales bacterium]
MGTTAANNEEVILVNERDEEIGRMEKHAAHRAPVLHRAFSIFLFDAEGRMLLQQRAAVKYHSPLLWTNACCSHPRPGERTEDAAARRLMEELGLRTTLDHRFAFTYLAEVGNGLTEHELDHVYFGTISTTPEPNPMEVNDWRYVEVDALREELKAHPARFTAWFHICWPMVEEHLSKKRA